MKSRDSPSCKQNTSSRPGTQVSQPKDPSPPLVKPISSATVRDRRIAGLLVPHSSNSDISPIPVRCLIETKNGFYRPSAMSVSAFRMAIDPAGVV